MGINEKDKQLMNKQEGHICQSFSLELIETLNIDLQKYGIKLSDDGSILGPNKPINYGITPKYNFEKPTINLLQLEKQFLVENFGADFSAFENKYSVLNVVGLIVKQLIGTSYTKYANIILMKKEDFDALKQFRKKIMEKRGIVGDYNGINMGGLILVADFGGNRIFPLLFHEIGHSFYGNEHNNYVDELRAMYFQILCTKLLEKELEKIGIHISYPNDYYQNIELPSIDHRKAYDDARMLNIFQEHYDVLVKGNAKRRRIKNRLLKIIKQKF